MDNHSHQVLALIVQLFELIGLLNDSHVLLSNPKHRTHARAKLQSTRWLGDEVISPRIQSFRYFIGIIQSRQHDNGQIGLRISLPDEAAYFEAIDSWHHDIKQDEVRFLLLDRGKSSFAAGGVSKRVAFPGKKRLGNLTSSRIIVDDKQ
jgi:hypothetical protein